jgi:hypothetical protein
VDGGSRRRETGRTRSELKPKGPTPTRRAVTDHARTNVRPPSPPKTRRQQTSDRWRCPGPNRSADGHQHSQERVSRRGTPGRTPEILDGAGTQSPPRPRGTFSCGARASGCGRPTGVGGCRRQDMGCGAIAIAGLMATVSADDAVIISALKFGQRRQGRGSLVCRQASVVLQRKIAIGSSQSAGPLTVADSAKSSPNSSAEPLNSDRAVLRVSISNGVGATSCVSRSAGSSSSA